MEIQSLLIEECLKEENILRTTHFLLAIDCHALSGKNRFRGYPLLDELQKAYDQFHHRTQKNYFTIYSPGEARNRVIKNNLLHLQRSVRKLIPLLKKPALDYLHAYIKDSKMDLPTYEIWE